MANSNPKMIKTIKSETNPWNVLIYMAADNNLKEEVVYTLTEIMKASTSTQTKIIAQLDTGEAVKRYDFSQLLRNAVQSASDLLELGVLVNVQGQSDAQMLREFLMETTNDDSQNMVVLSGHGSGAIGDFLSSEDPPSALSIPTLRSVLESAKERIGKIEVLGMDSCLMSMVEVCYELRDEVQILIGSEGFARNTGWPYQEMFAVLQQDPQMEAKGLASNIVREYIRFYSPYVISGVSVDQSACDLERIDNLKEAVKALADLLADGMDDQGIQNAVILAHWRAQSYKLEQYVDLWDFCHFLQKYSNNDGKIGDVCALVQEEISNTVLATNYSGAEFQHSHGISIYFPWAKSDLDKNLPAYENLAFDQATGWGRKFLKAYGDKTQRDYRNEARDHFGEALEMSVNYEIGIGIGVAASVKTNVLDHTKTNVLDHTKGGRIAIPLVKNPPSKFLKYDDKLPLAARKPTKAKKIVTQRSAQAKKR